MLDIGVSKVNDVVGNHQNLFNRPRVYNAISKSVQKVQPPCAEHVVSDNEVLLREGHEE